MRNFIMTLAGIGLICVASGCTEGHLCGYCDCDPGHDRCCYYYGEGVLSNYHPLHTGVGAIPGKAAEQAPPPKVATPATDPSKGK